MKTISEEEGKSYQEKYKDFIDIIYSSEDDDEIMTRVKTYDAEHGTDFFSEAVNFKVYCVACHRVDCIC